jgi:hypothetical protein
MVMELRLLAVSHNAIAILAGTNQGGSTTFRLVLKELDGICTTVANVYELTIRRQSARRLEPKQALS